MMYRVHWGEDSWEVEAEDENDARLEIATGLAQKHEEFSHPVAPGALDELRVEPVPAAED